MLKINRNDLPLLFSRIAQTKKLYLPVKTAGKTNFAAWNADVQVDLDTLKTVKSPKDECYITEYLE